MILWEFKTMKKKTVKQLKKIADSLWSEYVRKRDMNLCYTCRKAMTYKESQCGHFISRDCLQLRYDDANCHCQCVGCNVFKKGNMIAYTLNMIRDYGAELVELYQAIKDSKKNMKWTILDYEKKIEEIKKKIKDLHYNE